MVPSILRAFSTSPAATSIPNAVVLAKCSVGLSSELIIQIRLHAFSAARYSFLLKCMSTIAKRHLFRLRFKSVFERDWFDESANFLASSLIFSTPSFSLNAHAANSTLKGHSSPKSFTSPKASTLFLASSFSPLRNKTSRYSPASSTSSLSFTAATSVSSSGVGIGRDDAHARSNAFFKRERRFASSESSSSSILARGLPPVSLHNVVLDGV